MLESRNQLGEEDKEPTGAGAQSLPSVSLPKGGGAIRSVGEKLAANPVTGTGSMSVPIAISPGRSDFGPQLTLSYDSGAGNGPFGFGWSLSAPSITRKTSKGLPRYFDADESDVFLLSGAEDLVPVLVLDGDDWVSEDVPPQEGYLIKRYRPRIEGLFARIERLTRADDPADVHWRSITKDNILTLYGKDENSRIFDPDNRAHIFSWLICETRDDKGNAILYKYKTEDGVGVDLSQAHERNRGPAHDPRRKVNRYLKHIYYGNRTSLLNESGKRPPFLTEVQLTNTDWLFEVVFDYGEHDTDAPAPNDNGDWIFRADPFSSYQAGFEVRTTRLCQRVLMFHHIPDISLEEPGYDGLVRSTDFNYSHEQDLADARNPVYTFLNAVTQTGYKRDGGGYLKRSLPPVEFAYSEPVVQDQIEVVDAESLENLPVGLDGTAYQWTDLHGEGIPGILTEQAGSWFYKRNLSPVPGPLPEGGEGVKATFAPMEAVKLKPNLALASGAQFMDLAGDGQPDAVVLDGPAPGFYEHDLAEGWEPFRPFTSRLNRDTRDPNLKFVDLDGDGHADVLISEDDAFVWHPSLEEAGFGPAQRVAQALDEEKGPKLIFADGTQSIYLADLSGDGLTDLARIRNGEVCYWPNLGYGRFGAKVTMDNAPWFDHPDLFDQKRVRLADIDSSGTTDIIYLHGDGVRLYFNQSGNSWSQPQILNVFPKVDDLASITPVDLLGNGTACLVWSSPLPGDATRPMRYVNLMGDQKPHLLIQTRNNLGAEIRVQYTPSTKFYLQDKRDGKPWITRLPFPVHVVERVETYDHISRNRFVTRYAYHHGYFDGEEREFRGFGMVEQWDTEAFATLSAGGELPTGDNIDATSHVPPVHTKAWFHTGINVDRDHISDYFAGLVDEDDKGEYYREPGLDDAAARALMLPDTVLPDGLTAEEEREACRALKGMMLRQEVYALDGTDNEAHPYTVAEQNFTVRRLQSRADNRHAVLFTHPREALTYHYERDPADPRIQHAMTLEVDAFGNVLKEVAIGSGRRQPDPDLPQDSDRDRQTRMLVTYTENLVTNSVDDATIHPHDYRTPLPCETRTYELTGYTPSGPAGRFINIDFVQPDPGDPERLIQVFDSEIPYEDPPTSGSQRRLIEHVRTLYRPDDLGASLNDPLELLPLEQLEPLALRGESYKLAFTPGLLTQVYQRDGAALLPNLASVLGDQGSDGGGYLSSQQLKADGRFPGSDPDDHWWLPAGRVFLSPNNDDTAAQERAFAQSHFFLPHRTRDPFHTNAVSTESFVDYDVYDLLMVETRDASSNRVTVGERAADGTITQGNDYRVLQPWQVMSPNRNRTQVAFDTLGMVAGTAVMGKPEETLGDTLAGLEPNLTQAQIDSFYDAGDPHVPAPGLLGEATTRIVYDLGRFQRTRQAHPDEPGQWQPAFAATLARETHVSEPLPPDDLKIQISFSYSDGFAREIQQKVQAEPGPLVEGGPIMSPRWVGSGWTIFNNKGKPVRQYEPFFSQLAEKRHQFEFGVQVGVSPVLFYDPVGRVVATLHPNRTYEKVLFDPWKQTTYDVNDTCAARNDQTGDPRTDPDIAGYVSGYFAAQPAGWQTWHQERIGGALGPQEQDAAVKAAAHADTPTTAHFDTLGRPFLTLAQNRVVCADHDLDGTEGSFATRVELDIEGNQRAVLDERSLPVNHLPTGATEQRVVMRYAYDMLGTRVHQSSMEAGERWTLNDVTGKPIRAWDSRGHSFRTDYDPLRRPLRLFVTGADPDNSNQELLTERLVYGEQHPQSEGRNLRGVLYLHLDQAGAVTTEVLDFKGNPLRATRRLTEGTRYRQAVDWTAVDADHTALPTDAITPIDAAALESALSPFLEPDAYESRTIYDALNRPVKLTTPHTPTMQPNVIRPSYNEANLLERIDANLRSATDASGEPVWTPFVVNIDYDAKGQRILIEYGSGLAPGRRGVTTTYTYDPLTFRLVHMLTQRNQLAFPDDCPQPSPAGWPGCQVQNLHYTYDPAGNITHIRDDAQQTIYFRNRRVEPSNDYTYDAIYRLIEATGREHLGQIGGAPIPQSPHDELRTNLLHPGDGNAMGTYVERYVYDAVGNFLQMQHRGSDPAHAGWTRRYDYNEASLIEPGKQSNRLGQTTVGNRSPASVERYVHDAHGNMTRMPHLGGAHPDANMHWDYRDQLQRADLGGGGTAYYTYDAAGQRVRKVWEKSANRVEERIYFGSFEIFCRRQGVEQLERETLHIMNDKQRIALVETCTIDTAGNNSELRQLICYQFNNHLDSSSLELNDQAHIISYEEYSPYGNTLYQAVRSQTEVQKRFRYTGMERDEESGLIYNGARNYVPWLGSWASTDPVGIADHINLYAFVRRNPVKLRDQTGLGVWDWVHENVLEPTADFIEEHGVDDAVAGFGDTLSFGLSRNVRESLDIDTVDYESTAYKGGSVTGTVWGLGMGGAGAAKVVARYGWKRGAAIISGFFAGQQGITFGLDKVDPSGWASGVFNTGLLVAPLVKEPTFGKFRLRKPLTEAEITAALEGELSAGPFVKDIPASALESGKYNNQFQTGSYGKGGQQHKLHVDADTSAPGNTGTAKTTVRWHDPDPTAPVGSTSRTQTTLAIEQAKGKRRLVPDASQPNGGRWVQAGKYGNASEADRAAMHIPLYSDAPGLPFFSGAAAAAGTSQFIDYGSGAIFQQSPNVQISDEKLVPTPIIIGIGVRF